MFIPFISYHHVFLGLRTLCPLLLKHINNLSTHTIITNILMKPITSIVFYKYLYHLCINFYYIQYYKKVNNLSTQDNNINYDNSNSNHLRSYEHDSDDKSDIEDPG